MFAQKKTELTPIIEKIFHDNNQIFGAGKIHAILKDRGYKVAAKTVAAIMHENGWFAVGTSAKKIYLMTQESRKTVPHSVLRYQIPEYFESKYYRSIGVYKENESNTNGSDLEGDYVFSVFSSIKYEHYFSKFKSLVRVWVIGFK